MFEPKTLPIGDRTGRRLSGTTLIEVLVVIVIFLVGILAVLQIFPKGFQLLTLSRKAAQATSLARESSERLKARPDLLPEAILPMRVSSTGEVESSDTVPSDLGPDGVGIRKDGLLLDASNQPIGPWLMYSGPNRFRKIVGETHRISAPRQVGVGLNFYGSLITPEFAPLDTNVPIIVTGNVLSKNFGLPSTLTQRPTTSLYDAVDSHGDYEYFVDTTDTAFPVGYLPTGPESRGYSINVYAVVQTAAGTEKRMFRNMIVGTDPSTLGTINGQPTNTYPLFQVNLSAMITSRLGAGETLSSVETDSLKISRSFHSVAAFSNDPFEYRVLNPALGLILFNPKGYAATVSTPTGRSPLTASLDYAVLDWRILREDFRVTDARQAEYRLPLGSLKTNTQPGIDGTLETGIPLVEPKPASGSPLADISASQDTLADHFVLLDTETGGIYYEHDSVQTTRQLVKVDKSAGYLQFVDLDSDPSNGIQGKLLLPDGTIKVVDILNRSVRAYYMARDEWAVQVLKAASQYSPTPNQPAAGQYYLGGSNGAVGGALTRVYFPACDANQKVTLGELNYVDGNGVHRQILGQDFVVRYRTGDPLNYPSVDITDGDSTAAGFDNIALPVIGVKGASLVIRVLWNPTSINFTNDPEANLRRADEWGRNWRRSTVQTFVQRGENNR